MSRVQEIKTEAKALLDRVVAQRAAAREGEHESDASEINNMLIINARAAIAEEHDEIPEDAPQPMKTDTGRWMQRLGGLIDEMKRALGDPITLPAPEPESE